MHILATPVIRFRFYQSGSNIHAQQSIMRDVQNRQSTLRPNATEQDHDESVYSGKSNDGVGETKECNAKQP